jgi:hypothetical protein
MIREEMYFMPQKVWTAEDGVHVKLRGVEHRVISALRSIHGRLEPTGELHTLNLVTGETHAWEPMGFPGEK